MADDLIGIGKAAEALSTTLHEFLGKLLTPGFQEAGLLIKDEVSYWRNLREQRRNKVLADTQKRLEDKKIEPKSVEMKLLKPILEYSSLEEEDSELREKWISLLASAASGQSVRVDYPAILSQLSSTEVRILDLLYGIPATGRSKAHELMIGPLKSKFDPKSEDLEQSIRTLLRLQLCEFHLRQPIPPQFNNMMEMLIEIIRQIEVVKESQQLNPKGFLCLTALGRGFVKACKGPL